MAADAPGQAHRATGAGDQAEGHLGQAEGGVGARHHPSGEGRELDPRSAAGAVHVRGHAIGDGVDGSSRALEDPHEVRGGGVRPRAELVEVAARAERRTFAAQVHLRDRVVDRGELERVDELISHRRVERVADLGAGSG